MVASSINNYLNKSPLFGRFAVNLSNPTPTVIFRFFCVFAWLTMVRGKEFLCAYVARMPG